MIGRIVVLALFATVTATESPRDTIARLIHGNAASVAGERVCAAPAVRTFYTRRDFQPAWNEANLSALRRAIARAPEDGLQSALYHESALAAPHPAAVRDLLATDAFLLLGTHLSQGAFDAEFSRPSWCAAPRRIDVAAVLQAALDNGNVEESLARLAPRHEPYARLRTALKLYRDVERAGGWPSVPIARTSLRLGDRDPRVIALRQRLAREPLGVDPVSYPLIDTASDLFDAPLDTLVRHYQAHHGLAVDGIVGPDTLRELNIPIAGRIATLDANLERWRWMPEDLGARYGIVNIAGFTLDVYENGADVIAMKTVVGKQYTKTPFFAAKITEVLINPWWNVPDSIAYKELWPKQHRDHNYFAREHMVVMNGKIRQRPGAWNSLGRLKFNMPNPFDVYLHDTPAKSLFDNHVRAFSHGCIRLERPMDLAVYLLKRDAASIQADIDSNQEFTIKLDTPMPVYVLYWTARVGSDGHIEFARDIYDRDARLR